ncbi:MAG: hypothetical protein LBV04_00765 [Deferribacteraceae bacterium]|nr:hypothetical protein [Deferribacteraceae bacterium]
METKYFIANDSWQMLDKTETGTINGLKCNVDATEPDDELAKAYQELLLEHEKLTERNAKMLRVIERLASEDKAQELLNVRKELMETRDKLCRSIEMVTNYQRKCEDQDLKYSALNKRMFGQLERVLNVLNIKTTLRSKEANTMLTYLLKEFEIVKKDLALKEDQPASEATGDNDD